MNKKFVAQIILLIAVLLVIFMLVWRTDAQAQTSENQADEIVRTAIQNALVFGVFATAEQFALVEDVEATLDLLVEDSNFFVAYEDGALRTQALNVLQQEDLSLDEVKENLRQSFRDQIDIGDQIFELRVSRQNTFFTISNDGSRYAGLFVTASRLPIRAQRRLQRSEMCTEHVISLNILGNPAERITACTQALCTPSDLPMNCELTTIRARTGWFGTISYQPRMLPANGIVRGNFCRGLVQYDWKVGVESIQFGELFDLEISGAAISGSGSFTSDVQCQ